MDYSIIRQELEKSFSSGIMSVDENADIYSITVDVAVVYPVIEQLKTAYNFIFLTDICGIHYPDQESEFGVIYHLHNLTENKRIRIKTFVKRSLPVVPSITNLYAGANWMERETFDFFGIEFGGHPNLKRILNVEFMDYHPLRKEYPLEDATRDDKDDSFFGR